MLVVIAFLLLTVMRAHSNAFEEYCKEHKILFVYLLTLLTYSSHLMLVALALQRGRMINRLKMPHIIHITKDDFFPAICKAHSIAMTESNIQEGFQGGGFVPFDPKKVISLLDL